MMIKPPQINKNVSKGCNKFISTHNTILNCSTCSTITHSKCAKNLFQYSHTNDSWQCYSCIASLPQGYCPFASALIRDKHDPVHLDEIEDVSEINEIHKSCTNYGQKSFKNLVKLHHRNGQNLTSIFTNIDGNAVQILINLSQKSHSTAVIHSRLLAWLRQILMQTLRTCTGYPVTSLNSPINYLTNLKVVEWDSTFMSHLLTPALINFVCVPLTLNQFLSQ